MICNSLTVTVIILITERKRPAMRVNVMLQSDFTVTVKGLTKIGRQKGKLPQIETLTILSLTLQDDAKQHT